MTLKVDFIPAPNTHFASGSTGLPQPVMDEIKGSEGFLDGRAVALEG